MAYTADTPVTKAIVLVEVAKLLGTNIKDVGRLCTSEKIKMWAKYKPYKGALKFDDDKTGLYDNNYGMQVKSNTDGTMEWSYVKPEGGENSPYRLGDFWKYYHNAKPQYYVRITGPCSHDGINIDERSVLNMDIKKTMLSDENKFEINLINRQLESSYQKDYCIQNADLQYLKNYSTYFTASKVGTSGNAWSAFALTLDSGIYSGTCKVGSVGSDNPVTLLIQTGVASASLVGTSMPTTWLPPACITPYIAINATPRGVFYQAEVEYDASIGVALYLSSSSSITDSNGVEWYEYFITGYKFGGTITPKNEYDQDYSYSLDIVFGNDSNSQNVGIIFATEIANKKTSSGGTISDEQAKRNLMLQSSFNGKKISGTATGSHTKGSGTYSVTMTEDLTSSNGVYIYAKKTITTGDREISATAKVSAKQSGTEIDNATFVTKKKDVTNLLTNKGAYNYF